MDFPPRPSSRQPRPARRRTPEPESTGETGELDWTGERAIDAEPEVPAFAEEEPAEAPQPAEPERRAAGARYARGPSAGRPGRRRFSLNIRGETFARVLWALPWIIFAIAVVAIGGGVFAVAMI